MKILVTGNNGFIGVHLVRYLRMHGHEVSGIDRGDILPDPGGFHHVIHLGAISSTTYRDVDSILSNNLDYSISLLEQCNLSGTNFQYASSASVYGNQRSFSEDGPVSPHSPYAWSKYLFDRYVLQNINRLSISVQGFRYFNVYGPGEEHKGEQASPYHKFIKQAKQFGTIQIFENSEQYLRDFVYVGDVCKVHLLMLNTRDCGIYNVGTGEATSFLEVASMVAERFGASIETVPMPVQLSGQYQTYTCADLSKLRSKIDIEFSRIKERVNDYDSQ
jgi:ADP-L-glycero-D-manno-heptose 6-epimerase